MKFNSCDFILSYIELRVSPPILDAENRVKTNTVKLTSDAGMGEESIAVDILSENMVKDTVFLKGDYSFSLSRNHEGGEQILEIYPLMDDLNSGDVFETLEVHKVLSINSLENSVDSQEITDRVFGESIWATNKIVNRTYRIVVSGIKIKNDYGFKLIKDSALSNLPVYFEIWVEDNFLLPINGLAYIKKISENNLVDENVEIAFEMIIFKLGKIDKNLVATIGSEEFDVIISEGNFYLLSQ